MSGATNSWPYPLPATAGANAIGVGNIGGSSIGALPAFDWHTTILSQYATSDRITGLIATFADALDQTENFDTFYDKVWNLNTAEGYGLDVWGRIVGANRVLQVADVQYFGFAEQLPGVLPWGDPPFIGFSPALGFAEQTDTYGFAEGSFGLTRRFGPVDPNGGGGPFYNGQSLTGNYALSDTEYRRLIYAKAAANITSGSIPAINGILLSLFPGRGNCYIQEGTLPTFFGFAEAGNTAPFDQGVFYNGEVITTLQYQLVFRFDLSPVDLAIVQNSGVLPKPAGIASSISIQV